MNADEIIAMIKGLPAEERVKVAAFVRREFASLPCDERSFGRAEGEVFTEYRELLAKLAD